MKLEVGMYLRHSGLEGEYPIIQKIIKLETPGRCGGKYKVYTDKCEDWFIDSDYIEIDKSKASYNIIDLIGEGDYVNGYIVLDIMKNNLGKTYIECGCKDEIAHNYVYDIFYEEDIKTIVTKEQFDSMKYEVSK